MKAMRLLTVETMMMFRAIATVAVALGDRLVLGSQLSSRQMFACAVISLGGSIYASSDLRFNASGYAWGLAYALSMVVNTIYVKFSFERNKEMSSWEKTYLNNLLASPVILLLSFLTEDTSSLLRKLTQLEFLPLFWVLLSCVIGLGSHPHLRPSLLLPSSSLLLLFVSLLPEDALDESAGISFSGTMCRDVLSATSFDVLGNCNKYLTLAFNSFVL
eukprot:235047-Hanusia_phi.AAC.1